MKKRFVVVFFMALFVILLLAVQSKIQSGYESGELGRVTVTPVKDGEPAEGTQPQAAPQGTPAAPPAASPGPEQPGTTPDAKPAEPNQSEDSKVGDRGKEGASK